MTNINQVLPVYQPFFVTYIENGVETCDCWSAETLNTELNRNEVTIVSVDLCYRAQVALGLAQDD